MSRKYRFRTLAVVAAALLSVSPELDFSVSTPFDGTVVAQPPQRGGREGRQGRQSGGGNWNRQGGNRQGGGRFSPEQMIQSMTPERFERLRNNPGFASRMKEMVGADRWAQWERGDFSAGATAAQAAAQAAAAEAGELVEMTEMTDEEKAAAEATLNAGTVPKFNADGEKRYSPDSENEYYSQAMARRDDALVPSAPLALRFYGRYLIGKYDANSNGTLEREEWEDKLAGAQAIDLNGDWTLTDQEVLFYLARYASGRTIHNPAPKRPTYVANRVVLDEDKETRIRPASAPLRRETADVAAETDKENANALAEMSDEEVIAMFVEKNKALEEVEDQELLGVLLTEIDSATRREYAAPPEALKNVPVWFLARDVDGDGQLTLREFAPTLSTPAVAYFGKLDKNGDGLVVPDEVR
ncbi:MAG: hypothetical protein IJO46_10315 [Thermoguttaceae bacterium]|nr:hypothetical protein [Thermoguttaceae bacterium]MBQ7029971.1 hypothetical protein [Thermoguttaceae bacterium]MBQ7112282.1 hypothetical protein [Thermoguttaceae bacterium]